MKKQSGYVTDIPYTWEFFNEQSPVFINYLSAYHQQPGNTHQKAFTYCELGCGNGLTTNLLAAALPQGKFYGIDFNAEHIENAESLASHGQLTNAHFLCCSFAELPEHALPAFDFITLHGVYSWVSEAIRHEILSVIQKTLKPGGTVYVSYNPLPRWAEIIPVWRMMNEHTKHMEAGSLARARAGLDHLLELRAQGIQYFKNNPSISHFLDELQARNIHFFAHEFCNDNLEPQYFSDVAHTFAQQGMHYAGNAEFDDSEAFIPESLHSYIDEPHTRVEREIRRSLISNEFFRKDLYVLSGNKNTKIETNDTAHSLHNLQSCVVSSRYSNFQMERLFPVYKTDPALNQPIYAKLMQLAYQGQYSIAELCTHPALQDIQTDAITQALHTLIRRDHLEIITEKTSTHLLPPEDQQLSILLEINRYLLNNRLFIDGECHLASQIMGSALALEFPEALCLWARSQVTGDQAIAFMEAGLKQHTQQLTGRSLYPDDQSTWSSWLTSQLTHFNREWLPVLRRYEIIDG